MFLFSLRGGTAGAQFFFSNVFFSLVDLYNAKQQINCFCSFGSGFSEQGYVLLFYVALYLCLFEAVEWRLLQILISLLACYCS